MARRSSRRRYLRDLGAAALGGGAVFGVLKTPVGDMIGDVVRQASGPPPTKTVLRTVRSDSTEVQRLTLYESGAAEILFTEDHRSWDSLKLHHSATSVYEHALASWSVPQFAGPLTVDLAGAIPARDYPSRMFALTLWQGQGITLSALTFRVPEGFV